MSNNNDNINNINTSHVLKNRNLINEMEKHKSVTLTKENIARMQKLGFADESLNDIISKMLNISESAILQDMERTFQQQKLAASRKAEPEQ